MEDGQPPAKRPQYDLADSFDVVVGKAPSSQRFTLHSNIFVTRSGFSKAARKSEWLTGPTKPTDFQDKQPEVFSRYLNCVYFGIEALQLEINAPEDDRNDVDVNNDSIEEKLEPDAFVCSEAENAAIHKAERRSRGDFLKYLFQCLGIFIDLYLLADRLRDMQTANLVMDALVQFSDKCGSPFDQDLVRRAYDATAHGNPLRRLMRDECVYETNSVAYMNLHVDSAHPEFTRDVMVEFLRLRDVNSREKVGHVYAMHERHERNTDKCRYHQHDATHPRCVPDAGKESKTPTK